MNKLDFIKNLPIVDTVSIKSIPAENTSRVQINKTFQTSKGQDYNSSQKKALNKSNSLAHTSKVIKYETTGIIYLKKVQQQQKKLRELQNEIKDIQKQIQERRKYISNRKRKNDFLTKPKQQNFFITTSNTQSKQISIYRKQLNMNNPQEIKTEINLVNTKIAFLSKKINTWINQNKQLQKQIDAYRKQISLFNKCNQNLISQFQIKNIQFEKVAGENRQVNNNLLSKQIQLHRKKVSKYHEEAKLTKEYDNILKTVQKQMNEDQLKKNSENKPNFYMTEINFGQSRRTTSRKFTPASPYKKKKINNITLFQMKTMLENYQRQFDKLKQQTGTGSVDEITKKYLEEYQQNYGVYKYINQLNQQLTKQQNSQKQLKRRLLQIKQQTEIKRSKIKQQQLDQKLNQLKATIKKKQQYKKEKQEYTKIIKDLQLTLPLVLNRVGCTKQKYPQLNDLNLEKIQQSHIIPILLLIQKRKNELSSFVTNNNMIPKGLKFSQSEVQQQIQNAKKQYTQYQKLEVDKKSKEIDQKYEKFQQKQEIIKGFQSNQKLKKKKSKI